MKRLLRVSLDNGVQSFLPVVAWFALSIILDSRLLNVFILTYPLQFVYGAIKYLFATGANISKEKDNNKNAVMTGMAYGIMNNIKEDSEVGELTAKQA